eukprot:9464457-Prorocentrum_lima.AAC.1
MSCSSPRAGGGLRFRSIEVQRQKQDPPPKGSRCKHALTRAHAPSQRRRLQEEGSPNERVGQKRDRR